MASLRKKKNSPYWIIRYKSAKNGKWRDSTTKFRHDSPFETRQAEKLRVTISKRELIEKDTLTGDEWYRWVDTFIVNHFSEEKSRLRFQSAWTAISEFFRERGITRPGLVQRKHAFEFIDWRTTTPMRKKKPAVKNTAILEAKFLGMIMKEAVARGYVTHNPLSELGLKRDRVKVKEELSDDDIRRIREEIAKPTNGRIERCWMGRCFEIAIHQGVRLNETDIPMTNVDLESDPPLIHFARTKGNKPFTAPMHPSLIPFFRQWKTEGRETAVGFPKAAGKHWSNLFRRLKLDGKTFHSTRVTVASRLAKAGVPISQAMNYINHSSQVIHRAYQRWRPDDLKSCHSALQIPPA